VELTERLAGGVHLMIARREASLIQLRVHHRRHHALDDGNHPERRQDRLNRLDGAQPARDAAIADEGGRLVGPFAVEKVQGVQQRRRGPALYSA